ncbi:DUF3237 domain-containing protein [Sphingomonas sp. AOB5]|uniref:DUF3237 domain-containing protein n=1 Tax=Sphingomonas sp. AOB5 TaxID=3034017 RepID=UPI0023F6DA71|nr:DUF3237 domain-containing protein [Sphingomonas sp. AOB5]MDF7775404.1 DUF3237 domain-containing protein [Sphingomonas sp. AOB5]
MSRREAIGVGAAALAAGGAAPAIAGASDPMALPEPSLAFAFQLEVTLGPPQELGVVDGVRKRIIPITGGSFSGEKIKGAVMHGGADWQDIRPEDGLTRVFAHYWLKADDGAVISVKNNGVRRAPPEVMKKMMAGEIVPPADYYFRTNPVFDTGAAAHRWLNENMFVCVGARLPDKVVIRTYLVL